MKTKGGRSKTLKSAMAQFPFQLRYKMGHHYFSNVFQNFDLKCFGLGELSDTELFKRLKL